VTTLSPFLASMALTARDRALLRCDRAIRSVAPPATEAEKLAVKRRLRYLEEFAPRGRVKAAAERYVDAHGLETDSEDADRYAIRCRVSPDSFRVILRRVKNARRAAA
jgi:hypothetical protein